ncbi:MAG: GFA family protein, partial [Pseudohongiellaceae bacterium]
EKLMPIPFEGGCHCGAVRYVCSEEPTTVVNCHCGDCQQIAGSAFITGVLVPEGSVTVNGELKSYKVKADSGNGVTQNFCPICGTRIIVELDGGVVGVSYTTLDDSSWLEPAIEFYTSKAQPWINLCSNTEKLTDMT